jgi:predicted AlkP superfamily pyrophosphatase or phosphodiesterase
LKRLVFLILAGALTLAAKQQLLVVSIDGLDQRYLKNIDSMGLKIPNIRRLIREGQWSEGVVGVVPTITWPSHTTIITGVDPTVHGIQTNRMPASQGGDYPWSAKLIKVGTLLDAAHRAGMKTASITWPVTVDAPVDFNLPEYFQKRNGGGMDMASISSKSNPPDLVKRIDKMFPGFSQQEWMDDKARAQATVYILKKEAPDLMLVHLVDLDSEEHEHAPFSPEANARLEATDALVGQMVAALPEGAAMALVSDHGFEKVNTNVNIQALAEKKGVAGIHSQSGVVMADTPAATAFLRATAKDKQYGIGRQVPAQEVQLLAPQLPKADSVYEPADGFMFVTSGEIISKPKEIGNHGHWPARYRAVCIFWGKGIPPGRMIEMSQKQLAVQLAAVLGIAFVPGRQ